MIKEIEKSFAGFKVGRPIDGQVAMRISSDGEPTMEHGYPVFVDAGDRLLIGEPAEIGRIMDAIQPAAEDGKVDINTAYFDELRNIKHISVERAHAIIARRPWESIEDLISITGIGKVAMREIKEQNLATV